MKLTLPYPPSANRYWRTWKGRAVTSPEANQFKRTAALLALEAGFRPAAQEIELSVSLRFFRPRKAGDLDNRIKVCLDALNGICWRDDSQIVELHAYRAEDKDEPRVEIEVKEIGTTAELGVAV